MGNTPNAAVQKNVDDNMAIKVEVKEEDIDYKLLKVEKKETCIPKSEVDTNYSVSNSASESFKRKVNEYIGEKDENDCVVKDYYSSDIADADDQPYLKYRKPQNAFMQGYWPNPNEIDFEEFAREIAEDCMDDIPLEVPTDLPKVPGTKYVDLVVRTIPSFNCSLDSSDDEDYAIVPPQTEIKETEIKKMESSVIKKEEIKNEVEDMQATERVEVLKKIESSVIKKEEIKNEVEDMQATKRVEVLKKIKSSVIKKRRNQRRSCRYASH